MTTEDLLNEIVPYIRYDDDGITDSDKEIVNQAIEAYRDDLILEIREKLLEKMHLAIYPTFGSAMLSETPDYKRIVSHLPDIMYRDDRDFDRRSVRYYLDRLGPDAEHNYNYDIMFRAVIKTLAQSGDLFYAIKYLLDTNMDLEKRLHEQYVQNARCQTTL